MKDKIFLPIIIGPTGIGKTEIGIKVAKIIDAEIISCDARQIYKYMDIGTSKPQTSDYKPQTAYWLIDIIPPDKEFNAWDYAKIARKKIKEIVNRNKIPLVVGGSGLYLEALINGFFSMPKPDKKLRESLNAKPADELYKKLMEIDKPTAEKLHPNDKFRIIRAIEVYETTGVPISELKTKRIKFDCDPLYIGITTEKEELYKKIEKRVDKMINDGLINEVKNILNMGYSPNLQSLQTIGYKEIISYLNNEISLNDAIYLIKRNTKRYAKRQYTWFNKIKNVHWIKLLNNNISHCDDPERRERDAISFAVEECIKLINERRNKKITD